MPRITGLSPVPLTCSHCGRQWDSTAAVGSAPRCPECGKGHRVTAADRAAPATASAWSQDAESDAERSADVACPDCGTGMVWTTGKTTVRCPSCHRVDPPPRASARAAQQTKTSAEVSRVISEAEQDDMALALTGRKASVIEALDKQTEKNQKRFTAKSLAEVEWYRRELTNAETDARIDTLIARLRKHSWDKKGIFTSKPELEIADRFIYNESADADWQCQIYLKGDEPCENEWQYESLPGEDDSLYCACRIHALMFWPDVVKQFDSEDNAQGMRELSQKIVSLNIPRPPGLLERLEMRGNPNYDPQLAIQNPAPLDQRFNSEISYLRARVEMIDDWINDAKDWMFKVPRGLDIVKAAEIEMSDVKNRLNNLTVDDMKSKPGGLSPVSELTNYIWNDQPNVILGQMKYLKEEYQKWGKGQTGLYYR